MFKNITEYYIARLAFKDDITNTVVMEPVYGIACISISCTQIRALVKDPSSLHNEKDETLAVFVHTIKQLFCYLSLQLNFVN